MTILCITSERLPGVPVCTELGAHRVTCPDHPGWAEQPGICRGCLPRGADRGYLCERCYQRTIDAISGWRQFVDLVTDAGGRLVTQDSGGVKSGNADGYSNLTLVFLALDECERHLRSRKGMTVDLWVHTLEGARDAIQFARAAETAYRSLEVAEREQQVVPVRCPGCAQLTLTRNPTREHRGVTVVECQHCGFVLDEIRPDTRPRWLGSPTCEYQQHADCDELACTCPCHMLGARSRPAGVQALWDADQHTTNPGYRADWTVQDALTIQPTPERTAA